MSKESLSYTLFRKVGAVPLVGMLLLFFITDSLNVLLKSDAFIQSLYFIRLSAFSRGGVLLLVTTLFVFTYFKSINLWSAIFFVALVFVVGVDFKEKDWVYTWLIRFSKLVFPFLLFWLFYQLPNETLNALKRLFLILITIQVFVVIMAFMFNWKLFWAYNHHRFGFSGLILAPNEATFFYVLAAVFLLHQWVQSKQPFYLILLGGVLVASVLLGAKAIYIYMISFFFYYYIYYFKINRRFFIWSGLIAFSLITYLVVFVEVIVFMQNVAEKHGLITLVFSARDVLFAERVPLVLENWSWYNFMLGGVNPATSFTELDVVDMFLFGGILGSVLYYWGLFRTLFRFPRGNHLGWFLVIQYFLIGGLAGHVFASGINGTYLALVCVLLQREEIPQISTD
ncbi:hypothetical protein [Alkalitalea saponilacus]|uniref:O-antigen ligase like membrane protein n=1 Tax=Alkalitalea saponilacus TaxID=889453 RepID=A0A1T5FJS9_9BACT|nr:hypothetical protein [Alkalitalea saponilacus]ASB49421.1 hypothetical protein CDL62_09870 [Alkalitalea saponilacus]SKB96461.1 hypothetical protein SAMN03080601_01607 [Alkalitalea saponilacus]